MRYCGYPTCAEKIEKGLYCPEHQPKRRPRAKQRGLSACKRGYDRRWRRARAAYLARKPLCVLCKKKGEITPATVIDHIIRHQGDKKLFWDRKNWQGLCDDCHYEKTAEEMRQQRDGERP